MNNSIFESIFAVFDDKPPFLSILDTFWPIFGHFSYSTSINHSLTIELNNILNWITRVYFELNNILNWILGKAILNRILNESFFGKIQILNWIRLGIVNHYRRCTFERRNYPKFCIGFKIRKSRSEQLLLSGSGHSKWFSSAALQGVMWDWVEQ